MQLLKAEREKREVVKAVESIPIDLVVPNPYQPRRNFSDAALDELARSIVRYGLIQPIAVRRKKDGYELIAGERRLRASKRAGFSHINAIVYDAGEQDSAVIALIENLQRENLHFFDEAEAYRKLLVDHGLTQDELARRIGKNQSTVANKLRILRLSKPVRDAIISYRLTERHARTILRIEDEFSQMELISRIKNEGLSVKATEDLVEKLLDKCYNEEVDASSTKRVVGIIRDNRIVTNSVRTLVKQINGFGFDASYRLSDMGDHLEIMLNISKLKKVNIPSAV